MRAIRYAIEEAALSLWRGRQAGLLSTLTIALALFVLGGFLLACGTVEPRPTTNNDSLIAGPPLPARTVFPPANDWNRDVSADSVDVDSDSLIAHCGAAAALHPDFGTWYQGALWGIPFATVHSTQPRVPV